MDIQLQQIFEPVFVGIIAGTIFLLILIMIFGGRVPRFAHLLVIFVFGEYAARETRDQIGEDVREPTKLETMLATALIVSIAYSFGLFVERVSDSLMDGPAQFVLLLSGTDQQIKLKQFRELFEDEGPENDPACRPYTDQEIEQTYYTANNYLKGADPRAKELDVLSRRIHFSESIAIVLVFGGGLLLFVLLLIKALGRYIDRKLPIGVYTVFELRVKLCGQRWKAIRSWPIVVLGISLVGLAQIVNMAWKFDEEKYDTLVFGYYAVELQRSLDSQRELPRADVGLWVRLPDRGGLLRGAGQGLFEASGVAWLAAGLFSTPVLAVVNDNSQDITIHDLDGNLLQKLTLPDAAPVIADLEEIAPAPDGSHFLLGSHSTYNQVEDAARQHLIRIDVATQKRSIFRGTADNTNFSISNEFEEIDLKGHLSKTCFAPDKCLRRGWKETKPSQCCDVNLEAMAVSPDGADLYLGFREPVICDEDKKPVSPIYRLNLEEHRNNPSAPLQLVTGIPADLRSEGFPGPVRISGMAFDRSRNKFWILSSYEKEDDPDGRDTLAACNVWDRSESRTEPMRGGALWSWNGTRESEPILESVTFLHKPEGIAVHPQEGKVIVFDNDRDPDLVGRREPQAFYSLSGLPQGRCAPLIPAKTKKVRAEK